MIATAKDFLENHPDYNGFEHPDIKDSVIKQMIEFAKLHVEAALEEASERATITYDKGVEWVDRNSILNSYPLTNIR